MNRKTKLSALIGASVVASMALSSTASADSTLFGYSDLQAGYKLAFFDGGEKAQEGKCGEQKGKEGKCGEEKGKDGKCGEQKGKDGKCGEGKCGEKKDATKDAKKEEKK